VLLLLWERGRPLFHYMLLWLQTCQLRRQQQRECAELLACLQQSRAAA
jgi:hypothetical protein